MTDTQLAISPQEATILEQVVVGGDLSKLTPAQRVMYYRRVCTTLGLSPFTRPFQYITLSGRLTLYCTKDATEQLRKLHGVSITSIAAQKVDEVYIVTASAKDRNGRTDVSTGAVPIKGLAGDALANAMLKAETKSKRRVTLSLVGLGWLDESEIESTDAIREAGIDAETGELMKQQRESFPPESPQAIHESAVAELREAPGARPADKLDTLLASGKVLRPQAQALSRGMFHKPLADLDASEREDLIDEIEARMMRGEK